MPSHSNTIFDILSDTYNSIVETMSRYEAKDEAHDFPWSNLVWESPKFRRAHLDVVDVRDTKKLFMMHLCIFPHVNDPSPIFGFDLIAGPKKVTGAFHDFSPVADHPLCDWFKERTSMLTWSKQRELPDWAKQIFSGSMIAAGNITDPEELQFLVNAVLSNLDTYLEGIGSSDGQDYLERQNRYCHFQKQNPHTPKVMQSLGFDEDTVSRFIQECLFPEC